MKRFILTVLIIASLPLYAQVSTPLPHREGQGGESLSLRQLTDSALLNNIATRQAHHDIEAAHEQRREAYTKYFPSISGTGLVFNANRGMAKMDIDPQR